MSEKEPSNVTMRIRIGDNELEVTGPIDFVEKKIKDFHEQQKAYPPLASVQGHLQPPPQTSQKSTKQMSVAQFFRKVAPKTDVDRILAAGYYLEKIENKENFTTSEAAQTIHSAKIPPPKNSSENVNKNIRKGQMMAAGDRDGKMAFVLTTDGEEAIEAVLNA